MTRRTVAGLLVAGALVTGGGAVAATSNPAPEQGTSTQAFRLLDGLAYKACSLSPTCRNV